VLRACRRIGVLAVCGVLISMGVSATPSDARAAVGSTIELTGHGYGHGRGLGQWGSYGLATEHGFTYDRILNHYYGNTTAGSYANAPIAVQLTAHDGQAVKVTSSQLFSVGDVPIGPNTAAWVQVFSDGRILLRTSYGCGSPDVWETWIPHGRFVSTVANPGGDRAAMLNVCTSGGTRPYRGELAALWGSGAQRTLNNVLVEDYLRGVVPRESPAGWGDAAGGRGMEALRAQSVAARSYALSETRSSWAKTCDTTSCQVYGGAASEDRRTDQAIATTAGQIRLDAAGRVVRTEFSSSTGGYTAGGQFPAVPDPGDTASPHHNWTTTLRTADIAASYGLGTLDDIQITRRNGAGADGGRVLELVLVGTAKTVTVTGGNFRSRFGLRSDWFSLPVTVFSGPSIAYSQPGGSAQYPFGNAGDGPLLCDWDGNGSDTPGVFRSGVFVLSRAVSGAGPYTAFSFGNAGDQPICGDWNGDGKDTVGVVRGGIVFLTDATDSGRLDSWFAFGNPGDLAVSGDWNGDGKDTVGLARSGWFFLRDSNAAQSSFVSQPFGNPGDRPLAGDWNGDRRDTVGVKRGDAFFLRNESGGFSTVIFGLPADRPLAADPDGDGADTVAIARGY
jgi:SpoIID/LytB domain protein